MIIRNFSDMQDGYDSEDLSEFGIIKHKRTIYLFVDKRAYEAGVCKTAKVAILNECVYRGDDNGNLTTYKVPDSTVNRTALYFGTVSYEVPNDIRTAMFAIEVGLNKERQTYHRTDEVSQSETAEVSTLLTQCDPGVANEYLTGVQTTVVPPMFYTEMHMYKMMGDWGYFMLDSTETSFEYSKLVDHSTRFEYMDIGHFDTMKSEMIGRLQASDSSNPSEAFNLSETITSSFAQCMFDDSIFVYDSDAKGLNAPGVNVVGGKVTYGKFMPKEWLARNRDNSLTLFEQACHLLESQYGHVRVHCHHSELGNKVRIKFKDYTTTTPVVPMRKEIDGTMISTVDQGYSTNNEIAEQVQSLADNCMFEGSEHFNIDPYSGYAYPYYDED